MLRDLFTSPPTISLSVFAALLALGGASSCSSSDSTDSNVRVGDIRTNDVWKNGTKLTGVVRIFEGATVQIEPGARITCSEAAMIQVGGTVRVKAGANHATITCARWPGFQVVTNGSLDIEGLDIENADVGVDTTENAGAVTLTDSQILTSTRPFRVGAGTTMTLNKVKATTPTTLGAYDTSVGQVFGTLIAKHLTYDANTHEGIMVEGGGTLDMEDSTLKGQNGKDLVSAYRGAKSVKVSYSHLSGAHCGPHMEGVDSFVFDHVTSESNLYGITIYKTSTVGPFIVKDSNINGIVAWLDLQGDHGALEFTNVFATGGNETIAKTDPPKTLTKAPAKIEGAGPRN